MTLPTPEALREAVAKVKAAISEDDHDCEALDAWLESGDPRVDLLPLVAAADLLLSEEWQGMAEVCKAHYEIDHNTPLWDIEAREQLVLHNAISLGRKLAAQEQEK